MRTAILLGLVASALAVVHCGSSDGSTPAATDPPGSDNRNPIAHDAGCHAASATDDPDDQGVDANCDGADGVVGKDVYVNGVTGQDSNAGTPDQPLRSIARALSLATTRDGRVLLAAATYEVGALNVKGSWSIFGGYTAFFVGAPNRAQTVLHADATGLLVDGADKASLAHLTVQSAAASDAKQPSSHGVRTRARSLVLDDVVVQSGDALDGAAGKVGAPGSAGISGSASGTSTTLRCAGATQPSFSFGAPRYASNAEGRLAGDYAAKQRPQSASAGDAGNAGADAVGAPVLANALLVVDRGETGSATGRPGYGAPGGGGGAPASLPGHYVFGGGGGTGGCPGGAGEGGTSGGASVGIVVLAGEVTLTRSQVRTGAGGAGGDGGTGGIGGAGGAPGLPTTDAPNVSFALTCTPDDVNASCAAYGGQGGTGGAGGHGGAGAGGWTIAILASATASATADSATKFDLGRAGSGGVGGSGRALNGRTTGIFTLP